MSTIKAIIVDDEEHCLVTLSLLLTAHCPAVTVVEECRSAKQALEAIEKKSPDLVFLDIEMPLMNGFEMLEQCKAPGFAIVFTTGYDQYALKAIRYSAMDYLLKPVDPDELVHAVMKVQEKRTVPVIAQLELLIGQMKTRDHSFNGLAIPTMQGYEIVTAADIIYCEAKDNATYVILRDNKKVLASRSLKEVEEQLAGFTAFIRVHHSYMVNLSEVKKYVRGEGGYLQMSNGHTVAVSRSRKESLLKMLKT